MGINYCLSYLVLIALLIYVVGAYPRIASFTRPTNKMSKSNTDNNSKILLTTDPTQIRKIIARALTDDIPEIYASPTRPGVTNLLIILSALQGTTMGETEINVKGLKMAEFKDRVTSAIVNELTPIQKRYEEVKGNRSWLEGVRNEGNERARKVASQRIREIKTMVGLV